MGDPYGAPPPATSPPYGPCGAPPKDPSSGSPYSAPPKDPKAAPPGGPSFGTFDYFAPVEDPRGAPPKDPSSAPPKDPKAAPPNPYGAPVDPFAPYGGKGALTEDDRLAREAAAAAEAAAAKKAEDERLAREAAAAAEAAAAKKAEEERLAREAAAAAERARLAEAKRVAEGAVTAGQAGLYYSDRSEGWYNCTVTDINSDGYSVNVTDVGPKQIPKEKLATHFKIDTKAATAATAKAAFPPATEVQSGQAGLYYSDGSKDWFKCNVTHVHPDGSLVVDVIGVGAKAVTKEKRLTNFKITSS